MPAPPRFAHAALLLFCIGLPVPATGELVLVVHRDNTVLQLQREQVVDIYMGRVTDFPDGTPALPIDLPPEAPLRSRFYRELVGKSVAQVNAYWARLLFTGRATPPRILADATAALRVVRENRNAIAYVEADDVDARVRPIYRLK